MKPDIKQAIMDTARKLFNEKGFHDTCMRDIAAALNISVGNLTYHYKKKEDLIEAILLQDHQKYQKPKPIHTFRDFHQLLQDVTDQKKTRPYYYRHYVQLAQMCPAVYEMQVSVLKDLRDVLTEAVGYFADAGFLKKEFMQEYRHTVDAILTLIVYGLPDFCQTEEDNQPIIDCVWSIIIPCFTGQGRGEYQRLMSNEKSGSSIENLPSRQK